MKRLTLSIVAGALCIALAACGGDGQQAAELRALSGASAAAAPATSPPVQIVASPTPQPSPTAAPTQTPQPTPEPQVIPVEVTRIVEVVHVASPTPQLQPPQAQPDIPAIEPCYVDGRKLKAADGSPCPWARAWRP